MHCEQIDKQGLETDWTRAEGGAKRPVLQVTNSAPNTVDDSIVLLTFSSPLEKPILVIRIVWPVLALTAMTGKALIVPC